MDHPKSQPTSITEFEQTIISRNYAQAEQQIKELVVLYEQGRIALTLAPFDRQLNQQQADLESYQVLEKLAFSLTLWFSDPNWQMSSEIFSYLIMKKQFINSVFAASSYHSTDHILTNLGLLGKANYSPEEIKRILVVFTIESDISLPWPALLQHMPVETAQTFTGLVASIGLQLSARAQNNINTILHMVEHLPVIEVPNINLFLPLLLAFFNCSSLTNPDKYKLKQWIAKAIQGYVDKNLTPKYKKQLKNEVKSRPFLQQQTILFIHEHYNSHHAMYRCWHSSFKTIKDKFNTVALVKEDEIDDLAKQDFDQVVCFKDEWELESILQHVFAVKPDMIIYPSIGMSAHTPFLASMRLAPIQVALPGHPSSSYISAVDYFIVSREGMTDADMDRILTEKWIECEDGPGQVVLLEPEKRIVNTQTDEIKIVVNGVIQKVSHQLIEMCQRITEQAEKKVTFVFFMADPKQDIEYFAAMTLLRKFLPNSILYPFSNYDDYLDRLAQCQFAIPTIPFGGTNSNIDLLRVGIPKLYLFDHGDLSGTSDRQIWLEVEETSGYCESVEVLEQRAITLINQPETLAELTAKIENIDISKVALNSKGETSGSRLLNSITKVMELELAANAKSKK